MASSYPEITGAEVRPGMVLIKPGESKPFTVGTYTGKCDKGMHYGQGCYDRIGKWLKVR